VSEIRIDHHMIYTNKWW